MYNTLYHPGGCGCEGYNAYRFPKPEPRKMRRLDATGIRIHTDKYVGEACYSHGVCREPVPVRVEESVKSFIIKAATECLEPVTYYTLEINHPLPDGIFSQPTFIQAEKCGLSRDPVKLVYTETVFPMREFDGLPKFGAPGDPAFPNQPIAGIDGYEETNDEEPVPAPEQQDARRRNETRLIPVELDLHGNTAFGVNFVKGIGPHPKTLVLFYTNRGTFSLCRGIRRRTDY